MCDTHSVVDPTICAVITTKSDFWTPLALLWAIPILHLKADGIRKPQRFLQSNDQRCAWHSEKLKYFKLYAELARLEKCAWCTVCTSLPICAPLHLKQQTCTRKRRKMWITPKGTFIGHEEWPTATTYNQEQRHSSCIQCFITKMNKETWCVFTNTTPLFSIYPATASTADNSLERSLCNS